jgi:hypothetical protein
VNKEISWEIAVEIQLEMITYFHKEVSEGWMIWGFTDYILRSSSQG